MEIIGLIGGTGDIGTALAVHLAKKFDRVLLGSRSQEKAEQAVKDILTDKKNRRDLKDHLFPETNENVVSSCTDMILTVPNNAALDTVKALRENFKQDQLLISAVANITRSGKEFLSVKGGPSVSNSIQELLQETKIAVAFQTIPSSVLYSESRIDADVLVCCDQVETFKRASYIISSIAGLRPLYAGSLALSSEVEGLTALLLNVAISNHLKNPTIKVLSF